MAKFGDLYRAIDLPACGFRQAKELDSVLGTWTSLQKVAIIITDQTRSLDPRLALKALETRLLNVCDTIVGLGLHRPMTAEELAPLARFTPRQHNLNALSSVALDSGAVIEYASAVAAAEWSISVGVAELHQYAGVSGGYKGIVVGCGSREFISGLHSRSVVLDPSVQFGRVEGNLFRERIDQTGRATNCALALNFVPSTGDWLFGIPDLVTRQARALIEPWIYVPERFTGIRLHCPPSKAKSFYQASRAATYLALSPNPALMEGGVIELVAECTEGLGTEQGFVRALQTVTAPWREVLIGEEPTGAGAQRILMLAKMAQRFQIRIVGCVDPVIFQDIGIEASTEIPALPSGWFESRKPFQECPQWRMA